MTRYAQLVVACVLLFLSSPVVHANELQLRGSETGIEHRRLLKDMQGILDLNSGRLSKLQRSVAAQLQTVHRMQRRLKEEPELCVLEYLDDACNLRMPPTTDVSLQARLPSPVDLLVQGAVTFLDGLDVEAGGCDDCIIFNDDVTFDDDVQFSDPVTFDDPVTFFDDFNIEGRDVEKPEREDPDEALQFTVERNVKMTFEQDRTFVVGSESRFEQNVMVFRDPDEKNKGVDPPDMFVQGTVRAPLFATLGGMA